MKYNLCIVLTLSVVFLVSHWEPINADNETGDSSIKPVSIESSVEKENHVSDDGSQIEQKQAVSDNMVRSNSTKPVNYFLMTEAASNMLAANSFKKFIKRFHRVYSGPAEFLMRQAVFTAKLFKIFMHNLKYSAGLVRYYLQIGPFADITKAEFDALLQQENEEPTFFEELTTKKFNGSDPARTENKHDDDYEELHDDKDATDDPRFESVPASMWGGSDDDDDQPSDPYQYYDPYGNPIPSYGYPYQQGGYDYMNQPGSSSGQPWDPNHYNQYYSGQSSNAPDEDQTAGGSGERRSDQMFADYRDCFTPAKRQMRSAACWAFAGISMLEYYHCKQTGGREAVPFSEQYWVDCGHRFSHRGLVIFNGAHGGPNQLHLLAQKLGLLEEVYRPFVGEQQPCEISDDLPFQPLGEVKVEIRRRLETKKNIDSFLRANIVSGPMYVSMRVPTDFEDMGKGVHPGKNCEMESNGVKVVTHGMVVVGHGIEDNEEFWLIRNSYGRYWGDEGYWRLNKNADEWCFNYVLQWEGVHFPVVSKFVRYRSSSSSTPPDSPPPSEPGSSPEGSYDQKKKKKKGKSLWKKLGKLGLGG